MSFDPVQDSIATNTSESTTITPELKIDDNSNDQKTKISNLLINDEKSTSVPIESTDKKDTKQKKKKFFMKDQQNGAGTGTGTGSATTTTTTTTATGSGATPEQKENKSYQTLLINSRSRHLKKSDGEPYYRKDIQFEFLIKLFFNNLRVFKNPYFDTIDGFDWPEPFKYYKDDDGKLIENNGLKLTFFELYLITLLKSNKISKILKDRLMIDINYALNFVIICLLVNIGRLNTTVNFDYAMKSQFRTYHSIPSLQVSDHLKIIENYYSIEQNSIKFDDENSTTTNNNNNNNNNNSVRGGSGYTMSTVKQLQDTPRIKSILKSINDFNNEIPKNFKEFIIGMSTDNKFNLNIISLIFLLCVNEFDIGRLFFPNQETLTVIEGKQVTNDTFISSGSLFNDIWLRQDILPNDKVNRFLWLIYLFKETNFQIDEILSNPFNKPEGVLIMKELNPNANIAQELTSGNIFITDKLRTLVPDLNYIGKSDVDDIDKDSLKELEFAIQMKELRLSFVDEHITDDEDDHSSLEDDKKKLNDDDDNKKSSNKKSKNSKVKILKKESNKLKKLNSSDVEYDIDDNESDNSIVDKKSKRKLMKKKITEENDNSLPDDSSITLEDSGITESILNLYGALADDDLINDNTTNEQLLTLIKKKKKKLIELPIKLTSLELENYFNSELKLSSNSKNTMNKKHKNKLLSEFIKDLWVSKMNELKELRLSKKRSYEDDELDDDLLLLQQFEKKRKRVIGTDKFCEFKIQYYKDLIKINEYIDQMESESETKLKSRLKIDKDDGFLDDIFKKI